MGTKRGFLLLTALNMPTWPQSFVIENGDTYIVGIPLTQPGTISVSLNWQGGPLIAMIKDQAGRPQGPALWTQWL